MTKPRGASTTRRHVLGGLAATGATAGLATGLGTRFAQAQSSAPLKLGFQLHRTGIGAAYGRWYERTTKAALKAVNDAGGINGRPVEVVFEDDGTDAARGPQVLDKLINQEGCELVFGPLFSNVVVATAPRAAELKIPYLVCSETHSVAAGKLNRWTMQPGITDVKSQVRAVAPFIFDKLGKKVTMIYPDYAFGYDHRDFLTQAAKEAGAEIVKLLPIPVTETSFTRYFAQIPSSTEVIYHVMVGPGVLTFVKELGEFYGANHPKLFGFIDSLEAVNIATPSLSFLEGTHFWEGDCRYAQPDETEFDKAYRKAVGVNDAGAAISDPKEISTYGHMFSCWETLYVIKAGMEAADYKGPQDRQKFVEAVEAMSDMAESMQHPQGAKKFNGKTHQVFGHQNISEVKDGKLVRIARTSIEDSFYPDETDYTKMSF